ncbi:MAG TPA: DUF1559 domain-containing protein [Pirellulales bacterium]|nr:DUF1559 domain-containing protein [Pirellulales bacterium]
MLRFRVSYFLLCLSLALATRTLARADDQPPPISAAEAAKTIAPFVDDETLAVAHVDVARLDIGKLSAAVGALLPPGNPLQMINQSARPLAESFLKAGCRDLFVIVSAADVTNSGVFAIVPVGKGKEIDEEALRAMSHGALVERIGDVLFIGKPVIRARLATASSTRRPELARALDAVAGNPLQAVVIPSATTRRVVEELLPSLPPAAGGVPTTTVTRGMLWAALGVDVAPELSVRLVSQAQSGETARGLLNYLGGLLRDRLPGNRLSRLLLPEVKGDRLLLALDRDKMSEVETYARPLFNASATAVRRRESTDHLKHIALAMHLYADVHKHFPTAAISDAQGKPLLSWRVALLPYLDQAELHREFHLDEPWDSEHNLKLAARMPAVYRSFGSKAAADRTSYLVAAGPGTAFDGPHGIQISDITDGTSNTMMIFEADDDHAVVWTKPDDLAFDPEHPVAGLSSPYAEGRLMAFCDGSVHFQKVDDKTMRLIILRNDGEPLPNPQ